jgi:apolipoprotein N-acyltransferase
MHFHLKTITALISGVALSFSQAPHELWFLIFPCFGAFYALTQSLETKKQVFTLSFIFALGYFIAGLYWIGNALLVEGNEYKWAWPLAVIALPALLSIFPALYVTINHILFRSNPLAHFIGFCVLLTASEWVRGHAFTGFPWNLYGYGLASNEAMAQALSLIGPYGLTLLTVFLGSSLGYIATQKYYRPIILVVAAITLGSFYSFGSQRLSNATTTFQDDVVFHIVQPNIAQAEKWKVENFFKNFKAHTNIINRALPIPTSKKHVVVWPETAIPPALLNTNETHQQIQRMLQGLGENAILLSGALAIEQDTKTKYYNSLMSWQAQQHSKKIYSKSHLVPFGEYIPFQKYIPISTITNFSGFERGQGPTTIKIKNFPSFSPLICYEIIFPYTATNTKETRPDYILTITNDAWYGPSNGPHQHFAQARFRAIEQGLPVVRSANTGISGMIDPYGRVVDHLALSAQGVVSTALPEAIANSTFYAGHKDKPIFFISFILLLFCLYKIKK